MSHESTESRPTHHTHITHATRTRTHTHTHNSQPNYSLTSNFDPLLVASVASVLTMLRGGSNLGSGLDGRGTPSVQDAYYTAPSHTLAYSYKVRAVCITYIWPASNLQSTRDNMSVPPLFKNKWYQMLLFTPSGWPLPPASLVGHIPALMSNLWNRWCSVLCPRGYMFYDFKEKPHSLCFPNPLANLYRITCKCGGGLPCYCCSMGFLA